MKKTHRILSLLLALVLSLGLLPMHSYAWGLDFPYNGETRLAPEELFALLPSQPREVVKPENISETEFWCTAWTSNDHWTLPKSKEAIFQEIIDLTEQLTSGKSSETEKAKAIYSWVAENVVYDHVNASTNSYAIVGKTNDAFYVFYNREATCGGYTNLANLMLTLAGMPTAVAAGGPHDGGSPHGWSVVYADGRWIMFDATWGKWDISPSYHSTIELFVHDGIFLYTYFIDGTTKWTLMPGYAPTTIPEGLTTIGKRLFALCASLTDVTIPNGVTTIDSEAFSQCSNLSSVTIPSSVTTIKQGAFGQCPNLTSITIPNSVTTIEGPGVFIGCTNLTSISFPDSITSFTNTGSMFSYCSSLTHVVLPDCTTEIGRSAFSHCSSLTSVVIPASVTEIDWAAFSYCYKLSDVYYGGTKEQWEAIARTGRSRDKGLIAYLDKATVHYSAAPQQTPDPGQPADPGRPADPVTPSTPTTTTFTDVPSGIWYADAVNWAVEKKITSGTSKTAFSPNATCTQSQILTFLWRSQGEPAPAGTVSGTQYYAKAAQWAMEQGLTDDFSANAPCTRAMVVTYLWKLAGSPKPGASGSFTDVPANLADAVSWAAENKITSGTSKTAFSPDAACTRGQIVTFLYRAYAE